MRSFPAIPPIRRTAALLGGSSDAPNSAESQQFFNRLFTPPSSIWETRYATFIDALVAAGVWAKLDCLYVFCCDDESAALTNLKQSNYHAGRDESSGSTTWTQNSGYSAGGAARRITSNFNPSTAIGANFTQNDASVICWSGTAAQTSAVLFSTGTAPAQDDKISLYPRWSSNSHTIQINDSTASTLAGYTGTSAGLWITQRTGSTAAASYLDNTLVRTSTATSTALVNGNISAWCAFLTRIFGIGASLDSTQRASIQSACNTLVTAAVGSVP